MNLYDQIKKICKSNGVSINKLEKELGFARSSISKFNANKPSIEKIEEIADYFHVSVDYLLGRTDDPIDTSLNIESELEAITVMDNKLLASRIKQARALRNYTLEDIANEIGVAKSTIQRYENGLINKPKIPVLKAIADSLEVNPAWLLGQNAPMIVDETTSKRKEGLKMEKFVVEARIYDNGKIITKVRKQQCGDKEGCEVWERCDRKYKKISRADAEVCGCGNQNWSYMEK